VSSRRGQPLAQGRAEHPVPARPRAHPRAPAVDLDAVEAAQVHDDARVGLGLTAGRVPLTARHERQVSLARVTNGGHHVLHRGGPDHGGWARAHQTAEVRARLPERGFPDLEVDLPLRCARLLIHASRLSEAHARPREGSCADHPARSGGA
jgi:hypothetical protein